MAGARLGRLDAAGAAVSALGATWRTFVRRAVGVTGLALAALTTSAHVGTNDAFFDGLAGPYAVRVVVRPPGVIPGQAQLTVRVLQGDARRVQVQAAQWNVGTKGAPAPDDAAPVEGERGLWAAQLWLMTSGSYMVNVTVDGAQGRGTATVPILAVATARLGMQRGMGWLLVLLGGLLVAGLVTMIGAAAREASLPPGEMPDRKRRLVGRIAASGAAAVAALFLLGGSRWWDAVDREYARGMYRPLASEATVRWSGGGARTLRFVVTDSTWMNGRMTPLIPDHGKLMHLFVVRDSSLDAFAHLHPTRLDSATFEAAFPPLPTGRYRVYADVVHESGFARTLVATADVANGPKPAALAGATGDDAWIIGPVGGAPSHESEIGDGLTVTWDSAATFTAGADATLRFTVRDSTGSVATLEPYMGMAGHAMVMRDDGSVFVHLHPMGSISVAAQQRMLRRERGDTAQHGERQPVDTSAHAAHEQSLAFPGTLGFPFAFPEPGRYRVWVQVKQGGAVRTAAFDTTVR
ncbi:MAG: hypothetical protein ACXW61_10120 [Gemmatirosa sp.]